MLVVFCLDILTSLCPSVATKSTLLSKKLKHAPFKAGLVGSLFIAYNKDEIIALTQVFPLLGYDEIQIIFFIFS